MDHLEIKHLGENHEFYVQSDTLLLDNVLENIQNMYLEIYELDSAHFLSATGLARQAALKNTKIKLNPLTDIDVLFPAST